MTDHPIPDDLLEAMARRFMVMSDRDYDTEPEVYRAAAAGVVTDMLSALAEWADGALIDPEAWEVVEAKRVPWEWDDYDRAVMGRGHSHDLPDSPEDMPLFRLSPREQADG